MDYANAFVETGPSLLPKFPGQIGADSAPSMASQMRRTTTLNFSPLAAPPFQAHTELSSRHFRPMVNSCLFRKSG